jgi:hypothetical protein
MLAPIRRLLRFHMWVWHPLMGGQEREPEGPTGLDSLSEVCGQQTLINNSIYGPFLRLRIAS